MNIAISPKTMSSIEKAFMLHSSMPSLLLMERAALSAVEEIQKIADKKSNVLILIGPGNNGGDGIAIGRILLSMEYSVDFFIYQEAKSEDCKHNFTMLKSIYAPNILTNILSLDKYDLIIDSIFGTGFSGAFQSDKRFSIDDINSAAAKVISIDVPSGLNAEHGTVAKEAIKADYTICFQYIKEGLLLSMGPEYTGQLIVKNIGICNTLENYPFSYIVDDDFLKKYNYKNSKVAHKASNGKMLLVAGSKKYAGAALIASQAALNMGIGMLYHLSDKETCKRVQDIYHSCISIASDSLYINHIKQTLDMVDSIVIGPGLDESLNGQIIKLIEYIKTINKPCLLDAQAINALALQNIRLNTNFILSPHPMEAARLLNCSVEDIIANYKQSAKNIYEKYACSVILKGARSIIYDGKNFAIIKDSSKALARAGSGDSLCGIIGALLANNQAKNSSFVSIATACYIHSKSAIICEKTNGFYSFSPQMLNQHLPSLMQGLIDTNKFTMLK